MASEIFCFPSDFIAVTTNIVEGLHFSRTVRKASCIVMIFFSDFVVNDGTEIFLELNVEPGSDNC